MTDRHFGKSFDRFHIRWDVVEIEIVSRIDLQPFLDRDPSCFTMLRKDRLAAFGSKGVSIWAGV